MAEMLSLKISINKLVHVIYTYMDSYIKSAHKSKLFDKNKMFHERKQGSAIKNVC